MDLRHLQYFLAVAHELNFTRAAASLHMAVSPLSRAIRELEGEVGCALLTRTTRNVELTEAGVALLPLAQDILARVNSLSYLTNLRASGNSELAVGIRSVPASFTAMLIERVFEPAAPRLRVKFRANPVREQIKQLLIGDIALAVISEPVDDPRIAYLPVMVEQAAVALPDTPEHRSIDVVLPYHLRDLDLMVGDIAYRDMFEEYVTAARSVSEDRTPVIGGFRFEVANGGVAAFTMFNPESPLHITVQGPGVVIRPLPETVRYTTHLAWLREREGLDDLGVILAQARIAFMSPVEY
ncbi:LysR family transcriptional regulator [Protaetiibacter intestinalis]|uniref:LysR family transcriptional regulator n=1 Tax=Protaetiibacter intestinalis TaxID=2419774 RepID=A0A387B685_9MICO|nr:LysR family transcriptional regulator [Protaetiibacter intestinalis]AYF99264.1 LysR family transcriptional regulator [Protaetiibacter intestinalis]